MSGHSKWSTIKRAKGATDAKRAAVFTKLSKLITIAAREKGGDLATNFTLKMAVDKAKSANMPKDNIERSIKRGTGELEGGQIEELIYEGVGPANSQFVIQVLTDNKNRSAAEIRHIFTKYGGALSSVMWNFEQKGTLRISNDDFRMSNVDFDEFELELIDIGADDILTQEEGITIYTTLANFQKIKDFLETKKIKTRSAEIEYIAKDDLGLSDDDQAKVDKLIDALDENEDIGDYYTNVNI